MICTSRQLSAPIISENVLFSSYPVPLSESVVTVALWIDFGQSWRVPSALGLSRFRAIPYLWSLWTGREDCCHHPLPPLDTSDKNPHRPSFETKVSKMFGTVNLEGDNRAKCMHPGI